MSILHGVIKRSFSGAAICAAMSLAAGSAQAVTPFQVDVSTAINNGLSFLATSGVFNNPSSVGVNGASGIAMEALLEKRASGNPGDPPQGYSGATAADQALLRSAAAYILDSTPSTSFYAYRDGSWMFALSGYALTNGPDKSVLAPGNPSYQTIKQAMDTLVTRTLASQNAAGYWCYNNGGCNDSSTTQFAVAGLNAARAFYGSNKSADDVFADPAKVTAINAALTAARTAYENNASCNVLTASERGHGYHPTNEGYKPSLQQTASGIYIQLFGGADVNSPNVQHYMEWVRNRYRYTDLDSMGNSWPTNSYGYYLWSSFKGMELIRQSGITPNAGNIGPNDLGTLPAASAPACAFRQVNQDPTALARPALFGAGGVGYYNAESKGQYFDYAYQLLSMQCANGSFTCTGFPGSWGDSYNTSHNSYALLVLQRATGVIVQKCDVDGNGAVNRNDITLIQAAIGQHVGANDVRDADSDGLITVTDVRQCTLQCTKARCAL
jgi:hypothetical protein